MLMDTIRNTAEHGPIGPADAQRCEAVSSERDAQGRCNRVKRGPKKRGKYHGVTYHRAARKWVAMITVCNQQKYLGLHEKAETAARIYDSWARRLHGAKATLNFPAI